MLSKENCPRTDAEILSALRGTAEQRDRAIECIYGPLGWAGAALSLVLKNGGRKDDGLDAVQDAFEVFVRKIRDGSYRGGGALKSFFIGICYYTWLKNMRPTQRIDWKDEVFKGFEESDFVAADHRIISVECREQLQNLLEMLGEPCASMLKDCYAGLSTEELMGIYGAKTPGIFRKRKFRCMEKLRELIAKLGIGTRLKECLGYLGEG